MSSSSDPVVPLLADLVAIPSVNPSLVPGAAGEGAIAEFLAARLARSGFDVRVEEAAPGRPNVVAVIEGAAPGPSLMLCGHLDTVGVEAIADPFSPRIEDGRLYGRGAQDMKAGIAAMVHAAEQLLARGGPRRGRVVLAAVADEEYASLGAEALVRTWTADAAVVTEPTGLAVGVAHKGFSAAEVVVHGRAAHGSRPADGRDAILAMGELLHALSARDRELQASPPHALLGTASLHASAISGGGELSSYPAQCVLQFERRTLPGEPLEIAAAEAEAICRDHILARPGFWADVRLLLARAPHAIEADHPLVRSIAAAALATGSGGRLIGLSFWTDAAILAGAGIPAVVFGPGGAGLHGPDEYADLDEVMRCRDALVAWLTSALDA